MKQGSKNRLEEILDYGKMVQNAGGNPKMVAKAIARKCREEMKKISKK